MWLWERVGPGLGLWWGQATFRCLPELLFPGRMGHTQGAEQPWAFWAQTLSLQTVLTHLSRLMLSESMRLQIR